MCTQKILRMKFDCQKWENMKLPMVPIPNPMYLSVILMHKTNNRINLLLPSATFSQYYHLPHKVTSFYLCSHFIFFRNRRLLPDFHLHTYNSATNSFGFIDSWMFLFHSIASRTSNHTLIPTSRVPIQVMLCSKMAKLMKTPLYLIT